MISYANLGIMEIFWEAMKVDGYNSYKASLWELHVARS